MVKYTDDSSEVSGYNDTENITTDTQPLGDTGWYWLNHLYNSSFALTSIAVGEQGEGRPTATGIDGWAVSDASTVTHVNTGDGKLKFAGGVGYNETATTFIPGSTNSVVLAGIDFGSPNRNLVNNESKHIDYYEGVDGKVSIRAATSANAGEVVVDAKWQSGDTILASGGGEAIRNWQPDFSSATYATTTIQMPTNAAVVNMEDNPSYNLQLTIRFTGGAAFEIETVVLCMPKLPVLIISQPTALQVE